MASLRRVLAAVLVAGTCITIRASASGQAQESSSSQRKSPHHVTIAEEEGPPADLAKAEDLIQKEKFSDAETLLRKLTTSDPSNYVAWFDLGFTENALGERDESIAAYRKSVAARPDVFESNLNLGLQLAKAGNPDAETFLRAATMLKPASHVAEKKAGAWLSLGHILEKHKPDEALHAYEQAAALEPKDAEPHLSSGLIFEKQNKFADAEREYKQALALDPSSSDGVIGLANIYMRGNRFPEAEDALRKVTAAHPDSASAHIQLGEVLKAEGKYDAAVEEFQAGQKLAPDDEALHRDLADAYGKTGKNDLAATEYRILLAKTPHDAELHCRLGESLLRQKKFVDAQQEFGTAVKLKPDFGEAYGDLAFAAGENKNFPLAIQALDARAKFLPEIPITYFLRASAYDNLKDVKKAAANYHLFLQAANGKYPDQEWQAKHRLIALEPKR